MSEWIKFTGSEEHKELLRNAINGWECKQHNGGVYKNLPMVKNVPFSEIDEFLIYEPHPHADMIIEWARTGRPVYVHDDICGIWLKADAPSWDTKRKYSFDPPRKKLKYRVALLKNKDEFYTYTVNNGHQIPEMINHSNFIKWIDKEWQEVEV